MTMNLLAILARFVPSFLPAIGPLLNPWVLVAFLVYTAAVAGFSGFKGYDLGVSKLHDHIAKEAIARVAIVQKIVKLAGEVRERWHAAETVIRTEYEYIEKETENVPVRDHCNVTAGWMRAHDAAARGDRRIEGAVDDPADTGITERRALNEVIRPNYQAFQEVANDLRACRAFAAGIGRITADP